MVLAGATLGMFIWFATLPSYAAPAAGGQRQSSAPIQTQWIHVLAMPGADIAHYFAGPVYRRSIGELQRVVGPAPATAIDALAGEREVIHVSTGEEVPAPPTSDPAHTITPTFDLNLRGRERIQAIARRSPAQRTARSSMRRQDWFENDTQGVRRTWNTYGITGTGVTIGVLDSGVDFGNPAMTGRYAVQPATGQGNQAYAGWPIAYDDRSLTLYLNDPDRAWPSNWGWYVNAGHAITGTGAFTFTDPLYRTNVYTVPGTSQSGRYYLGHHPDGLLSDAAVLVADETAAGVYDAVYLDLDYDGAFETRLSRQSPVGTRDLDGDGVQDISAGMLYWIADGANPPPAAAALYGGSVPIPDAGTVVAFMIDSRFEPGGGHGTMSASSAVGYDDDGVFVPETRVASFYSDTYGPLVQAPAPGARIVAMGNVYAGGSADTWYLFTLLGYDGVPNTGDEPDIVTMSFGNTRVENDGWDWESRYLTYLNLYYDSAYGAGASPLFVHSSGNSGYGYGTLLSPSAATALDVGASTQYGTLNAWGISETVSLPSRVNVGDVTSFSGRGPATDGLRPVDIVANGMAGTGAYPLNVSGDGTAAYVHWAGTSRSAPVVGGVAALVAQGFAQANGRAPTYDELRRLLMNGANDTGNDPAVQGAGYVNAFRSVQTAVGDYGLTVSPRTLVAGDYRGTRYPTFVAGLQRGETQTHVLTLTNPSPVPITVAASAQHLVEVGRYTATIDTLTDTSTNYAAGAPDYALNLTSWVQEHPTADLMRVRMTMPFEHFDEIPPTPSTDRNAWRLMVYNWWDDGDGVWWSDTDANGRIAMPAEIDAGDEWMRFDYSRLRGTQQELRVGSPYTRSLGAGSAGIWAGATHNTRSSGDNSTTLTFEVVFYERRPWKAVDLSVETLTVPAGASTTLEATIAVPATAAFGYHQGAIVLADTNRGESTQVPVTWQVWPDVAVGATLGGRQSNTPYDAGSVAGGFNWRGDPQSTDWRFYGFDVPEPDEGSYVLAHSRWASYPTDVDTLLLGPQHDQFSAIAPDWFGPYSLDVVGRSTLAGWPPRWAFDTATGTTEEWVAVPAQEGAHVLAQQAVLFGGNGARVPITTNVGMLEIDPYPLRLDPAGCDGAAGCQITASLRSAIDITAGVTQSHGFGWIVPITYTDQTIMPEETRVYSLTGMSSLYALRVSLDDVAGVSNLDLLLYEETGWQPDRWDPTDKLIGSTTSAENEKPLVVPSLPAGDYWLRVTGNAVADDGGTYDLTVHRMPSSADGALTAAGLPASIAAHTTYTFAVESATIPALGEEGTLVFGPPALPNAFEVPIVTEPRADLAVTLSGPETVTAGETITYTVAYTNNGPSPADDVRLTASVPADVSAGVPATSSVGTISSHETNSWMLPITPSPTVTESTSITVSVAISTTTPEKVVGNNRAGTTVSVFQKRYPLYIPLLFNTDGRDQ